MGSLASKSDYQAWREKANFVLAQDYVNGNNGPKDIETAKTLLGKMAFEAESFFIRQAQELLNEIDK